MNHALRQRVEGNVPPDPFIGRPVSGADVEDLS